MSESAGGLPGASKPIVNFPSSPMDLVFDGFESLNTKPTRPAIEDNQMFICDGFMPFGKNNLRTLYGIGDLTTRLFYRAPTGLTIVMHWFGNIATAPYCVVFLSDGSVVAVNASTAAATTIAPAGTIANPSPLSIGVTQWGNQYFIIVNAPVGGTPQGQTVGNGYFIWDGTLLYKAGGIGPDVTIQSGGHGYGPDGPFTGTITAVGGTGSGATFSAVVQSGAIVSITVTNPGSGYSYYDTVYLAFSGGGGNTTTVTQGVITSGTLSAINVINSGNGYGATTAVSIAGGGGYGATAKTSPTPVLAGGGNVTGFNITAPGQSYLSPPTVFVTDPSNTVAQAVVSIMPFGVAGTAIETYQNQVWVANGNRIFFTAPASATDFSPGDGGGAFPSYNSFLKIGFTALRQSNGFLYTLADSSLNAISGVQTSGNPPITTFSNQNVDPQIGSSWPGSVQVFSRNVIFANSFGVHVAYGGAVTKVSGPLDGIYGSVPEFTNLGLTNPSAAVAIIFGIHVYMLLLPIIDQVTGQPVNKLLMWDGKRFWTSNQEISLTWISTQEINSVMTAWGTDGTSIYPLFQNPSAAITKTAQSKLFDKPSYFFIKMANRVFALLNFVEATTEPFKIALDNGVNNTVSSFVQTSPTAVWTNSLGLVVSWLNNSGAVVPWTRPGLVVTGYAATQPGSLLGFTLQTQAPDMTVLSVSAVVQNYQPLL